MNKKYATENPNSPPRDQAPQQPVADDRNLEDHRPETPIQNTSTTEGKNGLGEGQRKHKAAFVSSPHIFVTLDEVQAAREYEELKREERISLFWWIIVVLLFMSFVTGVYYFITAFDTRRQQVVVTLPENQGVVAVQTPRNHWERPVVAYYRPRRPAPSTTS